VSETASDDSEDLSDYQDELAAGELIKAKRYPEAIERLKALCERNSGYAYNALGWFYETGTEVPVDMQEALRCYRKAIEAGDERAYIWLGHALDRMGDMDGARAVYEEGAAQDNRPCMFWLGCLLMREGSGAIDARQGRMWLNKAAENGHLVAQARLIGLNVRETGTIAAIVVAGFQTLKLLVTAFRDIVHDPEPDWLE
jgi:TPR repeat protein